jgi:hypothetical protein
MPLRSPRRRPGGLRQRVGIVLRWPVGLALVGWRYLWRTTPLYRSDGDGGPEDLPPALPDGVDREDVQEPDDGYGPLLHRCYAVRISGATVDPKTLVARLSADPNTAAPPDAAVFVRAEPGQKGPMRLGDEYVVRMPGPWDGPVRVVHLTPTSFRFATLTGHLEAGQIEFRAAREGEVLRFEIESWARAGDRLAALLYNRLRLAKEIQLNMWSHFCVRVAALAGGRPQGGITIRTRWVPWPPP